MSRDWLFAAAVLGFFVALLPAVKAAKGRWQWHAELARKVVHVVMGLVCLSFPWTMRTQAPVFALAGMAVALLIAIRTTPWLRERLGDVLGGIERRSLGEIYFPLGVALTFHFARGERLLFMIPVLVLTLADTTSCFVGLRYGVRWFRAGPAAKSFEGSLAFLVVAFCSAAGPLLLWSGLSRSDAIIVGLVVGVAIMLVEALTWNGLDNLLIPLGVCLLLRLYL